MLQIVVRTLVFMVIAIVPPQLMNVWWHVPHGWMIGRACIWGVISGFIFAAIWPTPLPRRSR